METQKDNVKISIYMDNGTVFEYYCAPDKAREHAHAIIQTGYRHTPQGGKNLEWFPPHRLQKVVVEGAAESTGYRDTTRAT